MKLMISIGILVLSLFANSYANALYCEGHCNAYWEIVSTIYKSGSVYNEVYRGIHEDCRQSNGGTGIVRYNPDCINHGSSTNCTLKCSYPVERDNSTSGYGEDRNQIANKINDYCRSYYLSYQNFQNFRLSASVGACR